MNKDRINWDFDYHAPTNERINKHENVRAACRTLAHSINIDCPDSREKSLAITNLEQAMMWAHAAIARADRPENAT